MNKNPALSYLHTIGIRLLCTLLIPSLFFSSFSVAGQSTVDSLKILFRNETNDSLKIIYGIELARQLHRDSHDEEQEYHYSQQAIETALKTGNPLLYARALDNLGLLYRYHQRYGEAIPLHTKAFDLIEHEEVEPIYKMIFANNAGVAGRYNQRYDLAVAYYMKALKIAEKTNDIKNIAISNNGIGNALGNIPGRGEEALPYFQRSLKAEKQRNNSLGVAMNYLSISDYYIDKKEFETARKYLQELLEINQEREDAYGLAITNEFYGISYLEEGQNLGRATFYFRNALDRFKRLEDKHKQAEILLSLGDIKTRQNALFEAQEYYQRSLEISEELNQHGLIMENSLRLSEILEQQNNPQAALQYLRQANIYEDSIKLAEQNIEIAALMRQYNLEQKENHIQLLEKDKALQETLLVNQRQKLERRKILMVLMGIGLLFILIVLLLQYRLSRTKKKTTIRIQQEEKEKMKAIYERNLARAEILVTRLRINPHFLFNSLNAITYLIQSEQNAKAMKYLVVFSRYTRLVLETSQKHVVPVAEELKLTRYYLTLEENRFEKDFSYEITGDDLPEVEKVYIPPLLLQPFIENAIWHGLLPSKKDKKMLHLKVISEQENIRIIIDDNGVGRKPRGSKNGEKAHKSMGMDIIKERVELFNRSYDSRLEYDVIDKKDENGTRLGTRIVFNLRHRKNLEEPMQSVS